MNGLSQAVAAYIAEHGEIDRETYEALEQIYATEASNTAASMDLRVIDKLINALDSASEIKCNDKTLNDIIKKVGELRNKARAQKDKLKDAVGESY